MTISICAHNSLPFVNEWHCFVLCWTMVDDEKFLSDFEAIIQYNMPMHT